MSHWTAWLVVLLVLCVSPEVRAAAAEGEHGPNWGLLGLQILNVTVLLLILIRFGRKPVKDFLTERSQGIRRQIGAAEARLKEAQAELEALRQRLERFDDEAREVVEQSAAQAEAERARAVERARAAAERIRDEAGRLADQEIERARRELQAEAAALAAKLAEDLLREHLGPEDDRRLISEYVERVGDSG